MSSLDSTFDNLRHNSKSQRVDAAKSDPLFYFVHARGNAGNQEKAPLWTAMLREDGKEVQVVSFVGTVLAAHRRLGTLG